MIAPRSKLVLCVAFTLAALVAGGGEVVASSYYSVTDLGKDAHTSIDQDGRQVVVNQITGQSVPFPTSDGKSSLDPVKLPTRVGWQGATYTTAVTFEMSVIAANTSGTVIGAYPSGGSLAIPWQNESDYYIQKQPDGSYGPLHLLYGGNVSGPGLPLNQQQFFLNSSNQIVLSGVTTFAFDSQTSDHNDRLLDINTGVTTDLFALLSPDDQLRYGNLDARSRVWSDFKALGLSDDGSILADVTMPDFTHTVVLLSPPTPTPEPSTLALLVVAGAGVAYRRFRRG